jgi:hypothetical protein
MTNYLAVNVDRNNPYTPPSPSTSPLFTLTGNISQISVRKQRAESSLCHETFHERRQSHRVCNVNQHSTCLLPLLIPLILFKIKTHSWDFASQFNSIYFKSNLQKFVALGKNCVHKVKHFNCALSYYFRERPTNVLFFFYIRLSVCHYHKLRITILQ